MIHVFSKTAFDKLCQANKWSDLTIHRAIGVVALISITSTKEEHLFKRDHFNVLNLEFDDADADTKSNDKPIKLFTEEDAMKIIRYALHNEECSFYIHCTLGVSRSGAVGFFLRQILNMDYEEFKRTNPAVIPNSYVLQTLHKTYNKML